MGNEQSRRDDLEAVGFMICYFLRQGHLPWMGLKLKKRSEKEEMLVKLKRDSSFDDMLEGQPIEFVDIMKYIRGLEFD